MTSRQQERLLREAGVYTQYATTSGETQSAPEPRSPRTTTTTSQDVARLDATDASNTNTQGSLAQIRSQRSILEQSANASPVLAAQANITSNPPPLLPPPAINFVNLPVPPLVVDLDPLQTGTIPVGSNTIEGIIAPPREEISTPVPPPASPASPTVLAFWEAVISEPPTARVTQPAGASPHVAIQKLDADEMAKMFERIIDVSVLISGIEQPDRVARRRFFLDILNAAQTTVDMSESSPLLAKVIAGYSARLGIVHVGITRREDYEIDKKNMFKEFTDVAGQHLPKRKSLAELTAFLAAGGIYGQQVAEVDPWCRQGEVPDPTNLPNEEILTIMWLIEPPVGRLINTSCGICMENVRADELESLRPCYHFFHKECMARWSLELRPANAPNTAIRCPSCRSHIREGRFQYVSPDEFARENWDAPNAQNRNVANAADQPDDLATWGNPPHDQNDLGSDVEFPSVEEMRSQAPAPSSINSDITMLSALPRAHRQFVHHLDRESGLVIEKEIIDMFCCRGGVNGGRRFLLRWPSPRDPHLSCHELEPVSSFPGEAETYEAFHGPARTGGENIRCLAGYAWSALHLGGVADIPQNRRVFRNGRPRRHVQSMVSFISRDGTLGETWFDTSSVALKYGQRLLRTCMSDRRAFLGQFRPVEPEPDLLQDAPPLTNTQLLRALLPLAVPGETRPSASLPPAVLAAALARLPPQHSRLSAALPPAVLATGLPTALPPAVLATGLPAALPPAVLATGLPAALPPAVLATGLPTALPQAVLAENERRRAERAANRANRAPRPIMSEARRAARQQAKTARRAELASAAESADPEPSRMARELLEMYKEEEEDRAAMVEWSARYQAGEDSDINEMPEQMGVDFRADIKAFEDSLLARGAISPFPNFPA